MKDRAQDAATPEPALNSVEWWELRRVRQPQRMGLFIIEESDVQALRAAAPAIPPIDEPDAQLLSWAVVNSHMLARRALAHSTSVYDREKWEHVLRICEKAGARSPGVLRASVPREITDGAAIPPPDATTDEEMVPHVFISRSGNDDDIWCRDCEYHRDYVVHVSPDETTGEERS